mmetsp:Transcript_119576/g.343512  ORF Transcript_119576/g.343512 Transcript_119576/m.343512 type:complete len:515 (+) Transcript_119576:86-1630(+)
MDLDTVVQTPPVRISSRRRRSRPSHCLRVAVAFRSRAFIKSLVAGCFSGSIALAVRFTDQNLGVDIDPSLPNIAIFSAFLTFASLVAAFRTSNALNRYSSAGRFVHMMIAGWYDAASTLVSFSRASERPPEEVENFRQVIVRLVSVLSALCMTDLQSIDEDLTHRSHRFSFEVLEVDDMDQDTRELITGSTHRVEAIFQAVQSLVVDAHRSGVLSIAPPLLTRSFQELGIALRTFHEAKMIACEPFPYAYGLVTFIILVLQALLVPFMVASFATGYLGSFAFSFIGTFLLWFVNMVADSLDNPFRKEANTLDLSVTQGELNDCLLQMLDNSHRPAPSMGRRPDSAPTRRFSSLSDLKGIDRRLDRSSEELSMTSSQVVPVEDVVPSSEPRHVEDADDVDDADAGGAGSSAKRLESPHQVPPPASMTRLFGVMPGMVPDLNDAQPGPISPRVDGRCSAPEKTHSAPRAASSGARTAGSHGHTEGDLGADGGDGGCDMHVPRCPPPANPYDPSSHS